MQPEGHSKSIEVSVIELWHVEVGETHVNKESKCIPSLYSDTSYLRDFQRGISECGRAWKQLFPFQKKKKILFLKNEM